MHEKRTNEDLKFFIGLIERNICVLRFYILIVVLLHNENYVVCGNEYRREKLYANSYPSSLQQANKSLLLISETKQLQGKED